MVLLLSSERLCHCSSKRGVPAYTVGGDDAKTTKGISVIGKQRRALQRGWMHGGSLVLLANTIIIVRTSGSLGDCTVEREVGKRGNWSCQSDVSDTNCKGIYYLGNYS